jgi:hypothetical protein
VVVAEIVGAQRGRGRLAGRSSSESREKSCPSFAGNYTEDRYLRPHLSPIQLLPECNDTRLRRGRAETRASDRQGD